MLWILQVGATALLSYKVVGGARAVFEEALAYENLSPTLRGILHENIGVVYRESRRPRLMLRQMREALEHYEQGGNVYRVCVALKNVGEAQWRLGYRRAANRSFREAETRASNLADEVERFGVLWNLANSFRRLGKHDREHEQLMRCLEIELPEEEEDKQLKVQDRLINLNLLDFLDV